MSLLTPEHVPVKVYRWDDAGAPALDKTAGCMMTIFKACLVTGYGNKDSAGWTMPFEDTTAGVKVLRPEVGPHTDFYLRLSADIGTEISAQIYLNMTDANTGDLKLQCATPFKYAKGADSDKWLLVASPRGVYFFCNQRYNIQANDSALVGSYFVVGDTSANSLGNRAVYMQHTGGSYNDGDYSDIFGHYYNKQKFKEPTRYVYGQLLTASNETFSCDTDSYFDGLSAITISRELSPLIVIVNKTLYQLPGLTIPSNGATERNFTEQNIAMDGYISKLITTHSGASLSGNVCVSTDVWSY